MIPRLFAVFLATVVLDVAPAPDGCDCDDDDNVGLESYDNLEEDAAPEEGGDN